MDLYRNSGHCAFGTRTAFRIPDEIESEPYNKYILPSNTILNISNNRNSRKPDLGRQFVRGGDDSHDRPPLSFPLPVCTHVDNRTKQEGPKGIEPGRVQNRQLRLGRGSLHPAVVRRRFGRGS